MAVYNIEKYRKCMQKLIGVNRVLTGKPYDTNLAVKCHNGTFVGTEKDGVRSYKGIPTMVFTKRGFSGNPASRQKRLRKELLYTGRGRTA